MRAIEVCEKVLGEKTAVLFRPRHVQRGAAPEVKSYDVKPLFTGNKRGWIVLDLFSASAVVAVDRALNPVNRERYRGLPLVGMVKLAFKVVK